MVIVTRMGLKRKQAAAAKVLSHWWRVQSKGRGGKSRIHLQLPQRGAASKPGDTNAVVCGEGGRVQQKEEGVGAHSPRPGAWQHALLGAVDALTAQPIPVGSKSYAYNEGAAGVTWFTLDSLASYLECAGELRYKAHVFQAAELASGLGAEACARVLHAHALPPFNADDPFTLEPPTPPVCRLRPAAAAEAAGVYQFSAVELARYLRATGCFKNPLDNSPLPLECVRLVGMLSGDAALGADMTALEAQRVRAAEEERILEFLGAEVALRFNDMLSLVHEDDAAVEAAAGSPEEFDVLRVGFILPDMHVALIAALADLDAISRPRSTQALQDARDRLARHKAESERRRDDWRRSPPTGAAATSLQDSKRYVIYKFTEMALDSWLYASDMFRQEDPRILKLNEVMRIHQVLLEST